MSIHDSIDITFLVFCWVFQFHVVSFRWYQNRKLIKMIKIFCFALNARTERGKKIAEDIYATHKKQRKFDYHKFPI